MIEIYDGIDSSINDKSFSSYRKNLGNKLFIYGCSRVMADLLGCDLIAPETALIRRVNNVTLQYQEQIFPFGSIYNGKKITTPIKEINDNDIVQYKTLENIINVFPNHGFLIKSYFSKYKYFKPYKDLIRKYYEPLTLDKRSDDSMIIMLRDSYLDSSFKLPYFYYLDILKTEKFDKLYVSLDHYEKHEPFIKQISNYAPIIIDGDILDVFKTITSFKKIIACQGTFSFWAAFLSHADIIYWPITMDGPNSGKNSHNLVFNTYVDLLVDDEERYKHIQIK